MPSINPTTRPAAVAGRFYPAQAARLRSSINELLQQARARHSKKQFGANPQALIVPHAGYIYSGSVAASAYASLPNPHLIRRVLLLGPAHRDAFYGVASPDCDRFETPLGEISIDTRALYLLKQQQLIKDHKEAHRLEHSLEVQLPYLQETLERFELVPLLVGDASPQHIAQIIDDVVEEYQQQGFNRGELLVIISSDLSHHQEYQTAKQKDECTSQAICQHSYSIHGDEACGCRAINGFMMSQLASDLSIECIDLCNSGDTCGNKDRVVGYGAFILSQKITAKSHDHHSAPKADVSNEHSFSDKQSSQAKHALIPLTTAEKKSLLRLARSAIEHQLIPSLAVFPSPTTALYKETHNCFVTLHKRGKLRGCMGALRGYQSLYQDVIEHAKAAAFRDYRYPPVHKDELKDLEIEISILSPEIPMEFTSEKDLLSQLTVGVDGLTIKSGNHQSTFLPAVWSQLHTPDEFLLHLKQKAGLSVGAWPDDIKAWRYSTVQFSERDM